MRSTTLTSVRSRGGATAPASPHPVPVVIIGISTALGNNSLQRVIPAAAASGRTA